MARTKVTERKATVQQLARRAVQQLIQPPKERKSDPATKTSKSGYRYRPGTRALMEIRKYQKSVEHLIPLAPFARFMREVTQDFKKDLRFTPDAIQVLQEATEYYVVGLMEDTNLCAIHRKRQTIDIKDMTLVRRLRREVDRPVNGN